MTVCYWQSPCFSHHKVFVTKLKLNLLRWLPKIKWTNKTCNNKKWGKRKYASAMRCETVPSPPSIQVMKQMAPMCAQFVNRWPVLTTIASVLEGSCPSECQENALQRTSFQMKSKCLQTECRRTPYTWRRAIFVICVVTSHVPIPHNYNFLNTSVWNFHQTFCRDILRHTKIPKTRFSKKSTILQTSVTLRPLPLMRILEKSAIGHNSI